MEGISVKESLVQTKIKEQQKVCTKLTESIHSLFDRLKNVVSERDVPLEDKKEKVQSPPLIPLARDIESNTLVLEELLNQIDAFKERLEN